ncbi:hypothetical protein RCO28_00930 [Streptomyces sp. LHD-70]|uniref:hypothetical protein n=1 Tax=Streptomyces sp. LHD-70 TaxID=3072140 RepID=UPI00280D1F46|nr:hypothetical protein [Streptomyces sp. LHD-70]MDQ8701054.1 hypothetical protein [Streptomyces sp. LHD-70]
MSSPYAHGPAPSASVIPMGGEALGQQAKGAAGCSFFALLLIGVGLVALLDPNGAPNKGGWLFIALALIPLAFVFLFLRHGWKARKSFIAVDHVGLWIRNPIGGKVIPWDTLAGVGLHWSRSTSKAVGTQFSLELCPSGPIDRDHPVLWNLVRDEEPLQPNLPRLRYRVPVGKKNKPLLVGAVQQHVPQLWLGEAEREPNHIGFPDVKGHKERTRGAR